MSLCCCAGDNVANQKFIAVPADAVPLAPLSETLEIPGGAVGEMPVASVIDLVASVVRTLDGEMDFSAEGATLAPEKARHCAKCAFEGTAAWCARSCDACARVLEVGEPLAQCRRCALWRCGRCCAVSGPARAASEAFRGSVEKGLIPLTFRSGSSIRTVFASSRPLGVGFSTNLPIRVEKVDGHGKALGIKEGWILASYGGRETGDDFASFFCGFVHVFNRLPGPYCLPLLFELPDALRRAIIAVERPLGVGFSNREAPAVVAWSGGAAAGKEVQVGWRLLRFADRDVADFDSFDKFMEAFAALLKSVPERKAR